jgi:hypothetical protein
LLTILIANLNLIRELDSALAQDGPLVVLPNGIKTAHPALLTPACGSSTSLISGYAPESNTAPSPNTDIAPPLRLSVLSPSDYLPLPMSLGSRQDLSQFERLIT